MSDIELDLYLEEHGLKLDKNAPLWPLVLLLSIIFGVIFIVQYFK